MILFEGFQIDWQLVLNHLFHLIVAYLLSLPIGLERERSERHFGLRTFPLVAGVSSAASIWNTGAIGVAVAFDRFEIAILLAALSFITMFFFGRVKEKVQSDDSEDQ